MMKIRSAMSADAEKIYRTHKASIETLCARHYCDQDIVGWVDILSPGIYGNAINEKIMIVAENEGEVSGLGILDVLNKEICAIYVHPVSKGTGLGKKILFELEYRARQKGIGHLTLCSTINALGFYEHHDYERDGTTFHKLPNGIKLECIRMHKILNKINSITSGRS